MLRPNFSVDRTEFAKALRLVGRAGKAVRSAEAILTFDDQRLNIDLSGNATQVDANGDWPTEVRLPGDALERLAKSLPENDPLPLKIEGEHLSQPTSPSPVNGVSIRDRPRRPRGR